MFFDTRAVTVSGIFRKKGHGRTPDANKKDAVGGGLSPETLQPSKDMELTICKVEVGSDFVELVREVLSRADISLSRPEVTTRV